MNTLERNPKVRKWTRPDCYMGAEWPDYYSSGVGQSRDSDALERANFDAMLKALGGEQTGRELEDPNDEGAALPLVRVIRENHWAVGWVEWIAIHQSYIVALEVASEIQDKLDDCPVIDEELFSRYETEKADEVWKNCYSPKERIEYIRKHDSQFEFRDFAGMLACVRGNYFAGHAGELLIP